MRNKENIKKMLKDCNLFEFSNLKIYSSSEISEIDLKPYYLNHYIEAYLLSNFRLSSLKHGLNKVSDIEAKNVEVFITTNEGLYKKILDEQGMHWVTDKDLEQKFGFVSGGLNICYINKEVLTKYLPPKSSELDSLSHEFTHILLPQYLNIEWEEYNRYWNNIFDEGFAVLLNKQYKYIFNIRKDFVSNIEKGLNSISIEYLKENGFLKIDKRFVTESFEYQYCASIVKKIDDIIRKEDEYISEIPLRGIFLYLMRKEEKGKCIEDDLLKDFNIDIPNIEKELREELGMS